MVTMGRPFQTSTMARESRSLDERLRQLELIVQTLTNLSGDLSGTLPSPSVVGISGIKVSGLPLNGQALVYNSATGKWVPTTV